MFASGKTAAVASAANYIEEVFSTYLYTGNGSTQTITNNIDLSTYGGLVWIKNRNAGLGYSTDHALFDTARGATKYLVSNATASQTTVANSLTSFNSAGFSLGADGSDQVNDNTGGNTYASWTFRKQPKFFDVVTYSGSNSTQTISHNLGSTPGCIIIKKLDSNTFNAGWSVYHRSLSNPNNYYLVLNTTAAEANYGGAYISSVDSSTFTIAGNAGGISIAGSTYVAYLFAHNAGGFGLTGTDNVISCGSFTTDGSGNATVNLGYEPQWIMAKASSGTVSDWFMYDNMRGLDVSNGVYLRANSTASETAVSPMKINATGFSVANSTFDASSTYIYIAIRRGPMKVPTSGTSVFSAQTGTYSTGDSLSVGFPADMYIDAWRTGTLYKANYSRLVNFANSNSSASQNYLKTNTTDAEVTTSQAPSLYDLWNTTAKVGSWNQGVSEVWWMFRRAPSFFDEVCYTGTGSATTFSHNLGVAPELMIVKIRDAGAGWYVYNKSLTSAGYYLLVNSTAAEAFSNGLWNSTQPTASSFTVGTGSGTNGNGSTYVAYLFATCAGVSKVGSYTGTGTTLQVDCGFTGGARFVLIKRTDSTGDWYVWDSARGIVSGNDSYLLLNSTAAEVTNTDYIDTYSAGFEISSTAPSAINASGGSFIFFAVA